MSMLRLYRKPIYFVRKMPMIPKDKIVPYGGKLIPEMSEKLRREMALKMLDTGTK